MLFAGIGGRNPLIQREKKKTGPWEDFANMNVTLKFELQVPAGKALSEYQLA